MCGGLQEPAWLFLTGTGLKATLTHRGNWPRGALVVFKLHGTAQHRSQRQPRLCTWGCFAPSPGSSPPPWVPAPLHSTQKQLMQAHRARARFGHIPESVPTRAVVRWWAGDSKHCCRTALKTEELLRALGARPLLSTQDTYSDTEVGTELGPQKEALQQTLHA